MILKEILEKVEQAKVKEIPFVMYKIPDADFIEVIIQKNKRLDHVIDFRESGFVMAPFDQHEKTVLFAKGNVYRYQSQIPSKSNLNLDLFSDLKINISYLDILLLGNLLK